MLSEAALQDFKKVYREEFGEEIADDEAVALGTNLLSLFHYIYRPVKKDWMELLLECERLSKLNNTNQ